MQVGSWLRDQGLEQYEEAFRQNDIDPEILRDLTAEDLIGLGVISVGHRRRLLAAIAALRETVRQSPRPGDTSAATGAERRQLTVMFVDLVESTALSLRLDPEEMSELLRHYQGAVAGAIARFEGHVAKYMGEVGGVHSSVPRSPADDGERARGGGVVGQGGVRERRRTDGGGVRRWGGR
ncbi:adenylate cyclase, partial [Rhizobium sp. SEMIA 4085]|nr:adenylate cyclase [Rhizobium sp. SEMIA 4085]